MHAVPLIWMNNPARKYFKRHNGCKIARNSVTQSLDLQGKEGPKFSKSEELPIHLGPVE